MVMISQFKRASLAEQVARDLRKSIAKGVFTKETGFPSFRRLADEYGISHNVMLKALKQLHEQGIIYLGSKRKGYELS